MFSMDSEYSKMSMHFLLFISCSTEKFGFVALVFSFQITFQIQINYITFNRYQKIQLKIWMNLIRGWFKFIRSFFLSRVCILCLFKCDFNRIPLANVYLRFLSFFFLSISSNLRNLCYLIKSTFIQLKWFETAVVAGLFSFFIVRTIHFDFPWFGTFSAPLRVKWEHLDANRLCSLSENCSFFSCA